MIPLNEPLSTSILAFMYFGDVVFTVSGAVNRRPLPHGRPGVLDDRDHHRHRRGHHADLLLGRPVWWTRNPEELILCVAASLATFFFITSDITRRKWMLWADALGLSVFGVVGCHIALQFGSPLIIAVFMGMVTATGGGFMRDVITNTQPMITCGQVYATAALLGSLSYASLRQFGVSGVPAELVSCLVAFTLRGSAIIFNIRMGPPGEFVRWGRAAEAQSGTKDRAK